MRKTKNLSASTHTLSSHKPNLIKSMMPTLPLSSRLLHSIRTPRRQSNQYEINTSRNDINTSRTNKQNICKKMQMSQTSVKGKMSYSNLHQQKKNYLSQSMVLSQSLVMMGEGEGSRGNNKLDEMRNQLRDLLSIQEDVESNLVEQAPNMGGIMQGIVWRAIVRSQEGAISKLEKRVLGLEKQLKENCDKQDKCELQLKILQLQEQLKSQQSIISLPKYQQLTYQLKLLQIQNQTLKKQVFNFRKQNCVIKRQLSQFKQISQQKLKEYDSMREELETTKAELLQKTNWLVTVQFEKERLQLEMNPNGLLVQLERERERLQEYIYGINKSFECLMMKYTITKRIHENQSAEIKTKYSTQIRILKDKLKKKTGIEDKGVNKVKTKKKPNLRIKVEDDSDDSLDWNLEDTQNQT